MAAVHPGALATGSSTERRRRRTPYILHKYSCVFNWIYLYVLVYLVLRHTTVMALLTTESKILLATDT